LRTAWSTSHLPQQARLAVAARGRDRHLVIARHWDADYVRQAHIREGKRVGLAQETVDALVAGTDPKLTDRMSAASMSLPTRWRTAPSSRYKICGDEKVLGETHRRGAGLLGYYTSVALAMKIHEVPIPQQQRDQNRRTRNQRAMFNSVISADAT